MNKGVKRSNTGYEGLADISTIQGFDPNANEPAPKEELQLLVK